MIKNIYGMRNVEIKEELVCWGTIGFFVYADTDRFGEHEIMAQFPTYKEAVAWCKAQGVVIGDGAEALLRLQIELDKSGCGKVQIGNQMFRRLYKEDGVVWGYNNSDGWQDITRAFTGAVMTGPDTGRTDNYSNSLWIKTKTIKFGNACTW